MEITKEAMLIAFEITDPLLIIGIAVGLLVTTFQAVAQIHGQTLAFVPRLIVIALMLSALGSWISEVTNEFIVGLFTAMATL